MLLFTVKKGTLPPGVEKPGLRSALYLNVLGIVVIAEPLEMFSQTPSVESPNDLGVDSIKAFNDEGEVEFGEDLLM